MSVRGLVLAGWAVYKWSLAMSPYTSFLRHLMDRVLGVMSMR